MTYDPYRFLEDHPVFRREDLVRDFASEQGLSEVIANRRAQTILSDLSREKKYQKIPKGPYVSSAVIEEAPDWLPYAVAGCGAPDAVLGLQAALWLHLSRPAPQQLHIFSSTLEDGFNFEIPSRNQSWEIIPIRSKLSGSPSGDPLSVPGIIHYEGKFQRCPLALRATTPERTLVDILDGLARRPRKPARDQSAVEVQEAGGSREDVEDGLDTWPSPVFTACWEALSSEHLDLDFDELLQYLHNQSRSKTTTAKVRFFFTIHKERFGIRDRDLRELSNLPKEPHYWTRAAAGTLISQWNLVVPNCLIPPGFTPVNLLGRGTRSRLKDGIQIPGTDLGVELKSHFGKYGITQFRDGQKAIIEALLEGRDAIAILPTGAGKSLTYQFPAILLDGPTLVISPLVSLMNDQVREAKEMGLVAYSLQKGIKRHEIEEVDDAIQTGALDLLFVAPESWPGALDHWPQLRGELKQIVVDEAHLINSWGQDFRIGYQSLGKLRLEFKGVPVLALSATLTLEGRQKIIKALGMKEGMEIQKLPVKRPHLYLQRRLTPGDFESRFKALVEFIEPRKAMPGIVYCTTQKETDNLAERLRDELYKVELQRDLEPEQAEVIKNRVRSYHARMTRQERNAIQLAFLQGDCTLMVATVAFGMGINKKDIRFIAHFGPPPTLEEYVQEVGRAGRDAFWADCLLIHSDADWVGWRKRLARGEGNAVADETAKGRWKRLGRLERVSTRRRELDRMERFVRGQRCLHREIEKAFYDPEFDKAIPEDCLKSCDHCLPPAEHREMEEGETALSESQPRVDQLL